MVAKTYADAIANSADLSQKTVFARSEDARWAFLSDHPDLGAESAASIEEIANDPDIDFVIVATPPNARRHIVEVLGTGRKPILMEKPVERTIALAEEIVEICEDLGIPLGVMLQHRARPAVADLRGRLGELGTLIAVEANVPWWRPQAYYDEPGRGTYDRDGGGVLISQAIHTLDLMLHLAGPVTAVQAMTASSPLHQMEAEDFAAAALRFDNGAVGSVMASTTHYPGDAEGITLNGTGGSAHLSSNSLTLALHDKAPEEIGTAAATGGGADPMAFSSDWHRDVIADFAQSVADNRAPAIPARAALGVHALIDAIAHSAKTGTQATL